MKTLFTILILSLFSAGCADKKPVVRALQPAALRYQTNYVLIPAETDARTGRVFPAEERVILVPVP